MRAPCWRVWTHETPALVLGCSQQALHERLSAAAAGPALEVLLRGTGGGAVLVGPWLVSLSLLLPAGHDWLRQGLTQAYYHLGQLHVQALGELGIAARSLPPERVAAVRAGLAARGAIVPDWACFGSLSPWEVVDARGRKLVGLAQRRRPTGALLVAGTLVGEPDWAALCAALGRPRERAALRARTTCCERLVPDRSRVGAAWIAALTRQLRRTFDPA